jgi:endonuclease YncB( thermonuclease family)
LQELLNAGPVTLADADRPTDRYVRRLAIVKRDGQSLGDTLIEEGLARPWEGRRHPWCS